MIGREQGPCNRRRGPWAFRRGFEGREGLSRLALESSVSVLHQEGGLAQANMQWHGDEASED